jgi:hypothetical protein
MKTDEMQRDASASSRRSLLLGAGAFASLGAFSLAGLNRAFAQFGAAPVGAMEMGSGDIGILNFAYALEQLEAAFYTQVLSSPYAGMDRFEARVLKDLRDHEVAHVQFFRKALGSNAIGSVPVNFSAIAFGDRGSVLKTAMTFEDVGVSAYNGAAQFLKNPSYLLAAGKIVSVEARHAAAIRDLIYPFSTAFAGDDVVDPSGLDVSRSPGEVAPLVQPFIAAPLVAVQG